MSVLVKVQALLAMDRVDEACAAGEGARDADDRLYTAKRTGRDRTVAA